MTEGTRAQDHIRLNRRRLLESAGVATAVGLGGCSRIPGGGEDGGGGEEGEGSNGEGGEGSGGANEEDD